MGVIHESGCSVLRVQYNNDLSMLLRLPGSCSASSMSESTDDYQVTMRKNQHPYYNV